MAAARRATVGLVLVLGVVGWAVVNRLEEENASGGGQKKSAPPAPVAVAPVERGPMVLRRTWSGTLEARARVVVAPRVAGRIERLFCDISDPVKRGQEVAILDDDEYVQAVAQAKAELEVAQARVSEATSAATIAERRFERTRSLNAEGISSESELDAASADRLAATSSLEVANAQRSRAEAALEESKVRLSYTRVVATWSADEKDEVRFVAERLVDEGTTVSASTPLLTVVSLDTVRAVVYATERDYARLRPGQEATLLTDAHPGRTFRATIERVAPVFREQSRQARVELSVANPEHLLKPGMFIRAGVELDRVADAAHIPVDALVLRDGKTGVFVLDEAAGAVRWRTVETGILEGNRVQLLGEPPAGRVVTLGQQLLDDGSPVTVPEVDPPPGEGGGGR